MTPAQIQDSFEVLFRAGELLIKTVGLPGTQGAGVTGIQGIGVKTPIAAEVALTTAGLTMDVHMPNGGTFATGR